MQHLKPEKQPFHLSASLNIKYMTSRKDDVSPENVICFIQMNNFIHCMQLNSLVSFSTSRATQKENHFLHHKSWKLRHCLSLAMNWYVVFKNVSHGVFFHKQTFTWSPLVFSSKYQCRGSFLKLESSSLNLHKKYRRCPLSSFPLAIVFTHKVSQCWYNKSSLETLHNP